MQIKSRSYNSKVFRPKPIIFQDENLDLIILVTAWGDQAVGQKAIDYVFKYLQSVEVDIEVTSPFESLQCLSDSLNHLKIAIEIMNGSIYRSENIHQISSGLEISILKVKNNQFFWAQVGNPQIFLKRDSHLPLQILSSPLDLNQELNKLIEAPLPSQLVGIEKDCFIQCGSCRITPNDRLYLISSSFISESSFKMIQSKMDLDEATHLLIKDQAEVPLWLGVIDFS